MGSAFKECASVQTKIGHLICQQLDAYLERLTSDLPKERQHPKGKLTKMFKHDIQYKGRLLHYFPLEEKFNKNLDSLCGWHLDHGSITILLAALYLDLNGKVVPTPKDCGLYVRAINGELVKCDVPEDCFLVQLG